MKPKIRISFLAGFIAISLGLTACQTSNKDASEVGASSDKDAVKTQTSTVAAEITEAATEVPSTDASILSRLNLKDASGKDFDITNYQNQHVVTAVFTTWCHYCREEMKVLKQLAKDYAENDNLKFLLINVLSDGEQPQDVINFLQENEVDLPVAYLTSEAAYQVGISAFPFNFIVNQDGNLTQLAYPEDSDQLVDHFFGASLDQFKAFIKASLEA